MNNTILLSWPCALLYLNCNYSLCINIVQYERCAILLQERRREDIILNSILRLFCFSIGLSHRMRSFPLLTELPPLANIQIAEKKAKKQHLWVYCLFAVHATLKMT